jgi:SAM-dependent methyltransferase
VDARDWDERYAASELVWSAGPNEFVARECAELAPGVALDLAAGEGRNAIWLANHGWDVTAVDFSEAGLDKGRQLAEEAPVAWVCADATTWSADRAYDLALIAYLQVPAVQRAAASLNAFESLRPGGTFLLVGHDSSNLSEGTGGPQDPALLMTAEDVLADLRGQAFEVVHAGRVPRSIAGKEDHRGEPTRTAWDCLVRLIRR